MKHHGWLLAFVLAATLLRAAEPDRPAYQSPYSVKFTFKEEELIGDLRKGSRADWKDTANVPFREWYAPANQKRWGYWGPGMKHFDAPPGLSSKSPQWQRERVIATGLRFVGYSYQHHHVPDWNPPADWPRDAKQTTPPGKGLDCSNFTTFAYNLALGLRPTSDVQDQAAMTETPGPGPSRKTPVRRLELPKSYEDFPRELLTGDLLFVKNTAGNISHVVLWVGAIGQSPDGTPLILDSTGAGARDANGATIPDGIHLRPFRPNTWYFTQASHVLRIIRDGK